MLQHRKKSIPEILNYTYFKFGTPMAFLNKIKKNNNNNVNKKINNFNVKTNFLTRQRPVLFTNDQNKWKDVLYISYKSNGLYK